MNKYIIFKEDDHNASEDRITTRFSAVDGVERERETMMMPR